MKRFSFFVFGVLPLLSLVVFSRADDWPQWRYDAARSAKSPDPLPDELELLWKLQLPTPEPAWPKSQPSLRFDVSYSPIVADKMLFVPSMVNDTVTAYETATGKQLWRFFTEGPVRLAPVYDKGKIYFGSDDGYLYCLDAKKGTLLWKYRGGPYERKILGNERLIATWPVRGGPVLKDGKIYFTAGIWPFMGIFVHAIDATTGEKIWTNSSDGDTYCDNPHSGANAFGNFVPRGHLAITDAGLVAPGGRTPPGTYDLKTGELIAFKFEKKGSRDNHGPVSITAGSREHSHRLDKVEGRIWEILAADDKLFAVTEEGSIYCFGKASGEPKTIDRTKVTPVAKDGPWSEEAANILAKTKKNAGYCVVLGVGSGNLARQIAQQSDMRVIVVDPDAKKVDAFRRQLAEAGVYGRKISAYVSDMKNRALPQYMAELVVSEESASQLDKLAISHLLRPYTGIAYLSRRANDKGSVTIDGSPLPGAADWTHQYADAGNSVVSKDSVVRAPLGLLWFGNGPPNDEVLPRHGHGPSPQVAAGRLLIEGANMLRGLDIYTGRLLWQRDLPDLGKFYDNTGHHPGAGEIGSNYVSLPDAVYVVYGEKILKLDPATGKTKDEFTFEDEDDKPVNWGGLSILHNVIVAAAVPVTVQEDKSKPVFEPARYSSASRRLVAIDRFTGDILWEKKASYGFRHNNIALGAGKVFCIDGLSRQKLEKASRRGIDDKNYKPKLMALDLQTGRPLWSTGENVFGTFLNYSAEKDILLQSGSRFRDRARDESSKGMVTYKGKDGKVVWQDLDMDHTGPCMLHGDMIISQGPAFSLLTGQRETRLHPLTGQSQPWSFSRSYGCNTAIASQNLITFRSAAAGYFNLENDGGTGNFGGFKSSCTSNLIIAGGLLNAPEYTRTCGCNYQNQTSLALAHDPKVETWTFSSVKWDTNPVRRVGINFGAPGNRRANTETLWLDYPSVGGPSPDVPVLIEPKNVQYIRQHSALFKEVDKEQSDTPAKPLNWVAASAVVGAQKITLSLARDKQPRKYTIRLHFAENEKTQHPRVMDVTLQGKIVLEGFDIAKEAGGVNQAIVKEFKGVTVTEKLEITLDAKGQQSTIISGVEAVAEGW